ncbi:hypothetical protein K9L27_02570 [Candidatus Gracilibacteria bacterium]|nr:hypothetical protein [Candidatus Gracilibacteria bacterium]
MKATFHNVAIYNLNIGSLARMWILAFKHGETILGKNMDVPKINSPVFNGNHPFTITSFMMNKIYTTIGTAPNITFGNTSYLKLGNILLFVPPN